MGVRRPLPSSKGVPTTRDDQIRLKVPRNRYSRVLVGSGTMISRRLRPSYR